MEMLLKMNQENEQVDSGLAQVYLLGGTFEFWKRGIGITREQKMVFRAAFPLYYELSIREADGASVKCSATPL